MSDQRQNDVLEADAGTPQSGAGDAPNRSPFPWEKSGVSTSANTSSPLQPTSTHDAASPSSSPDPLSLLAKLTMMLAHQDCAEMSVPQEVCTLIHKDFEKTIGTINKKFFTRLLDMEVISESYYDDLKERDLENEQSSIVQDFLSYLFAKNMWSVLKFTQVLFEERQFDFVKKIMDLCKLRAYFPNQPKTADFQRESPLQQAKVDVKKGEYHGNSRIYKMSTQPRGQVLIINNEDFRMSGGEYNDRLGTNIDGDALTHLFKELSFQIYKGKQHWNLTTADMRSLIQEFASYEDHQHVDASIVCILSHGTSHGIAGIDGSLEPRQTITPHEVQDYFSASNCPHLAGKPKIFLFVACRGTNMDNGMIIRSPQNVKKTIPTPTEFHITSEVVTGDTRVMAMDLPEESYNKKIPNSVDFISIYATVPGYQSLRSTKKGTWFVQDFVSVVSAEAYLSDLATMTCEVNRRISERMSTDGEKQSLFVHTTLRKSLFFNPGF